MRQGCACMQAVDGLTYLPGLSGQVSNMTVSLHLLFPCELDASSYQKDTKSKHQDQYLLGNQE